MKIEIFLVSFALFWSIFALGFVIGLIENSEL